MVIASMDTTYVKKPQDAQAGPDYLRPGILQPGSYKTGILQLTRAHNCAHSIAR